MLLGDCESETPTDLPFCLLDRSSFQLLGDMTHWGSRLSRISTHCTVTLLGRLTTNTKKPGGLGPHRDTVLCMYEFACIQTHVSTQVAPLFVCMYTPRVCLVVAP